MIGSDDRKGNIVRFPRRSGDLGNETAKSRRADRDEHRAATKARADAIRKKSESMGKLDLRDRVTLAQNLGRLLFSTMREKRRGWVTDLLYDAGFIKDRTESTKHLRRYALEPDTHSKRINPKRLGARLRDYIRLADGYSGKVGLPEDETLVKEVCSGVDSLKDEYDGPSVQEYESVAPLTRMLSAIGESVARRKLAAEYFRALAHWHWESCSWDKAKPWVINQHPAYAPGEFLDHALLPRVELFSIRNVELQLKPIPNVDLDDISFVPITNSLLNYRAYLSLWLVLSPSGPSRLVKPFLVWDWRTHIQSVPGTPAENRIEADGHDHGISVFDDSGGDTTVFSLTSASGEMSVFDVTVLDAGPTHLFETYAPEQTIRRGLMNITPTSVHENFVKLLDADHIIENLPDPDPNNHLFSDSFAGDSVAPRGTVAAYMEGFLRHGGAEELSEKLNQSLEYFHQRNLEHVQQYTQEMIESEEAIIERLNSKINDD